MNRLNLLLTVLTILGVSGCEEPVEPKPPQPETAMIDREAAPRPILREVVRGQAARERAPAR